MDPKSPSTVVRYHLSDLTIRSLENLESSCVTSGLYDLLLEFDGIDKELQCYSGFCWFFCLILQLVLYVR